MSTAMATEETGLPIAAAAEQLGVHPRTLRRYISDGRLSAIRYTSQVVRIQHDDLDRFLAENIRIETGTGTCYVPRPKSEEGDAARQKPSKASKVKPRIGHFG